MGYEPGNMDHMVRELWNDMASGKNVAWGSGTVVGGSLGKY